MGLLNLPGHISRFFAVDPTSPAVSQAFTAELQDHTLVTQLGVRHLASVSGGFWVKKLASGNATRRSLRGCCAKTDPEDASANQILRNNATEDDQIIQKNLADPRG
jgi:hypothetical protein